MVNDYLNSFSEDTPVYTAVVNWIIIKKPHFLEFIKAALANQKYQRDSG
jgi:hypothetical protein|tara:strand:+ start:153 stop:299 length:147 start_codon:yes stop_codon:yes gene_type:complete